MNEQQVLQLAQAAGLSREWTDAFGKPQQVTPDALARILEALGFPCGSEEQCRDSLSRVNALKSVDHLPPLVTTTISQRVHIPLPAHLAGKPFRIELENGNRIEGHAPAEARSEWELPPIDAWGYHHLQIGEDSVTLAVAPPKCYGVADALAMTGRAATEARLWGLAVQLYSLHRPGDGGIGDFTALEQFARRSAAHGAAAVAISPVHAMFSADVHRFSPYGPSSRLFLNALHIDPAAVLGPDALASTLVTLGAAERYAALEREPLVDWPSAASLRLSILRELYRRSRESGSNVDFDIFRRQGGRALRDHACFEAMHAFRLARGESGYWRDWPDGWRDPHSPDVDRFAAEHAGEIDFHEFLQWQAARGLGRAQKTACEAGMPIGLITDLAVGADNGGSQAWSRQGEIINGLSVGAPPDVLNTRGQAWGLGAFSPHAMKAKGFGAYIEMLRSIFAYAGGARIDHVLGLGRLWLVPDGESPQQGAYLQYPMQDLLRLIALESWRHRAVVIGEDLGTVPPGFDTLLAQAGLLGIRVLLFQHDWGRFFHPNEWPGHAIATTTTHDLPPIAGWWQERDIDWRAGLDLLAPGETESDARSDRARDREKLWRAMAEAGYAQGGMPAKEDSGPVVDAAAAFIAATPAPLAMLPVEDALGLNEQPNLPGTIDTHPNWRRRLPHTVDALLDDPAVAARLGALDRPRHIGEKS